MKILFFCAQFYPLNIAGAYRPSKFAKYLMRSGLEVVVITIPTDQAAKVFNKSIDESLLDDLDSGLKIYEVPLKSGPKFKSGLKGYFEIVDNIANLWKPNLEKFLPEIIYNEKPNWIYTSLPPFSLGRLTIEISKKFDLKSVIDLRDAWSQWCIVPYRTYWHYKKTIKEERYSLQEADVVLTTSQQTLNEILRLHKNLDTNKCHVVPNGYDAPINWESVKLENKPNKNKFSIGYVGSFYYTPEIHKQIYSSIFEKKPHKWLEFIPVKENWLYRSPYFFFQALNLLLERYPDYKNKVRLDFVGNEPIWLIEMVKEFRLEDIYYSHGFVTNKRSLELQNRFDAFLSTSAKIEGKEDYSLGSKNFEYIQFKKPILGFVTKGVLKDFLQRSGLGVIFYPDDVEESMKKLKKVIDGEITVIPSSKYLKSYHRHNLTNKLLKILKLSI